MNREPYELNSERVIDAWLSQHDEALSDHRLVPEPRVGATRRDAIAKRGMFNKEVRR